MKREIKFRAWDKKKKKMGSEFSLDDASYEGFPYPFVDENGDCDLHAEYEVMQYTGLKDKNGKEIYEGDVVRCDTRLNYEDEQIQRTARRNYGADRLQATGLVQWDTEGCDYNIVNAAGDLMMGFGMSDSQYEVLGNIYENPDLIS